MLSATGSDPAADRVVCQTIGIRCHRTATSGYPYKQRGHPETGTPAHILANGIHAINA